MFLEVSAHPTPQQVVCARVLCAPTMWPQPGMEKNQVQLCLPWKKQITWAGEKGAYSPLLACSGSSGSFSRHCFSISFQGDGTTLAVLTDVFEVAPCGQEDMVARKNGLHMLAAK